MKKNSLLDFRLIFSIIAAHLLLYFSFHDKGIFWYIFSGSILILITFAMAQSEVDDKAAFIKYFFTGIISGVLLYFLFWIGHEAIKLFHLPFQKEISRLYGWYAPSLFWHFISLILVAAPGEELFWRGFIQKRLLNHFRPVIGIAAGAIVYASVHIYSGSFILVFSALVSGFVWGLLYYWKKSMPLVIVSHIVFDLMIFIIMPFR